MSDMCDFELIGRWREGDMTAFDALIRKHDAALETFLRQKTGPTECLDLKQKVWEALMKRPPQEIRRTFRAYLIGTARKFLYRFYEHEQRDLVRAERAVSLVELETSLSQRMARKLGAQHLLVALQRLPLNFQEILLMRYVDELTEAEMAEILEVPRGTVKSRLFEAKKRMRDAWPDGRLKI